MITMLNADLLSVACELPRADVVITDPPYGSHVHANTTSVNTRAGRGVTKRDLGFGALCRELRTAIAALAPRRWSIVFSDVESTGDWRAAFPRDHYVRALPWVRWSQPQLSGDRPPSGCEMVSIFHPPGRKAWNGSGGLTHFDQKAVRNRDKFTAEKPLDLMLELVSSFSMPGELVIDPCAGVGTTAVACKLLGRSCLALEIDSATCARAESRLETRWDRDAERAQRWVTDNLETASAIVQNEPRTRAEQPAWERAVRRSMDRLSVWEQGK